MRSAIRFGAIALTFITATFYTGCLQGPTGTAGLNGSDGTAKCAACHNDSTRLLAKEMQWEQSGHAEKGDFSRNTATCARCHTNEGFNQAIANNLAATGKDLDSVAGTIANPTPQNCRTCHKIHTNFDSTDFGFKIDTAAGIYVKTIWNPNIPDADQFGSLDASHIAAEKEKAHVTNLGAGMVCAVCHQPRYTYRRPIPGRGDSILTNAPAAKGDSIYVPSGFSTHHGTEMTMLKGIGGYDEVAGMVYPNSDHTTKITRGCPQCHMATPASVANGADAAGGHTLRLSFLSSATATGPTAFLGYIGDTVHAGSPNASGCLSCHVDPVTHKATIVNLDYKGVQEKIIELENNLLNVLVAKGAMTSSGSVVAGWRSNAVAGAIWNYMYNIEDKSSGVHNYKYASALLSNSIQQLSNNTVVAAPQLVFPRGTPSTTAPKGAVILVIDTVGKAVRASTHTPKLDTLPFGGAPTSCASAPALQSGLTLNATTCAVSGTPTVVADTVNYVITGSNAVGKGVGDTLRVKVIAGKPVLSYTPNTVIDTLGQAITHTPTVTANGAALTACAASPALPAGLAIANTTCIISGTPTAAVASRAYTITATNSAGTGTTTFTLGTQ